MTSNSNLYERSLSYFQPLVGLGNGGNGFSGLDFVGSFVLK